MHNILKEKQNCLSSENSEDVSLLLALLQVVWKCKPGVGVSLSPKNRNQRIYTASWNMQNFIDMVSFLRWSQDYRKVKMFFYTLKRD